MAGKVTYLHVTQCCLSPEDSAKTYRNQTLPYEVTYPTQNVTTRDFGTWPIMYEGIDCPTGGNKLQYHIQNVSTVVSTYLAELLKHLLQFANSCRANTSHPPYCWVTKKQW